MSKTKRWPLKADFLKITLAEGIALVNNYASICGLEGLRKHRNFRTLSFLDPVSFDRYDLFCALQVAIDEVNAAQDDKNMVNLEKIMTDRFGELDKPIAITVLGHGMASDSFVIEPRIWLKGQQH